MTIYSPNPNNPLPFPIPESSFHNSLGRKGLRHGNIFSAIADIADRLKL